MGKTRKILQTVVGTPQTTVRPPLILGQFQSQ
jgi:hypothetical protein